MFGENELIENTSDVRHTLDEMEEQDRRLQEHVSNCRERAAKQMAEIETRFTMNNHFTAKRNELSPGSEKTKYNTYLEEKLIDMTLHGINMEQIISELRNRIISLEKKLEAALIIGDKTRSVAELRGDCDHNKNNEDNGFISADDLLS